MEIPVNKGALYHISVQDPAGSRERPSTGPAGAGRRPGDRSTTAGRIQPGSNKPQAPRCFLLGLGTLHSQRARSGLAWDLLPYVNPILSYGNLSYPLLSYPILR